MKKLVFAFMLLFATMFASCGNSTKEVNSTKTDTTVVDSVHVDSTAVDSTAE